METSNRMSTFKTINEALLPLSPFSFSDSPPVEQHSHHNRCSSESFLIEEEQPSWLDDLLNDSETVVYRGHRRTASDSYAYLGKASASLTKRNSLAQMNSQEGEEGESSSAIGNNKQESTTKNLEDKAGGSQAKNTGSKTETKRSKQQNAYRSRVRKLQYINHLERTLEILKAEGSEVSAELEFVEQQNIILTMENRALRQRLQSLSHEQIIKHWEQGMLEREIGRLQSLHNLQKQQQQQQQMQMQNHHHYQQQQTHNQHSKHRRNGRDYDYQANMKNKEATSAKDSVNTPIHV